MCHEDKMKESERVCEREVADICNYEIESKGHPRSGKGGDIFIVKRRKQK